MLKLRSEAGRRDPQMPWHILRGHPMRVSLALTCARMQARMLVGCRSREIPLISLMDAGLSPTFLFACGLVDLLTWQESEEGTLTHIHRIDLALSAAEELVHAGHLARCFLPVLVAGDLLPEFSSVVDVELLEAEFAAWLDCGGLCGEATPPLPEFTLAEALGSPRRAS